MKRERKWTALCLALALLLGGCGDSGAEIDQLFRGDTVVNIPLHPENTEAPTQAQTVPETTAPTEPPATEETQPAPTASKSSTGKTSGSRAASSRTAATEPPETAPPETQIPETTAPAPAAYDISGYAPGALEYAVAEQINAKRAEAGIGTLTMDGALSGVASLRAYEVCQSWSHTRPDGSGWATVLAEYGFGYAAATESLAHMGAGFDGAAIVEKWMSADSTRADLLSEAYSTIGVGVYSVDGTIFVAAILIG